jgi:serine/threonine protein kinase
VVDVDFEAEVELESLLGTGAFGAVYRGRWRRAGATPVAIKMLHHVAGGSPEELAAFRSEVAVLSRLAHPRIVRFLGAGLSPPHACMLEELVEGGSLHAFLHGCGGSTTTAVRCALALRTHCVDDAMRVW